MSPRKYLCLTAVIATMTLAGPGFTQAAQPAPSTVPNPSPTRELPQDRGYDKHTPKHDAVDAAEKPVTQELNREVEAKGGNLHVAPADQAQYDADRAAYRQAVVASARQMDADIEAQARKETAYADAMMAWRKQVRDCEAGIRAACNAPTPDPADFY